ncbi:hypothetical protein ACIBF1_20780 [Spirillospora sp. NPDC050679]
MRFSYRDIGLPDLLRRGIKPDEAPVEVLLLDIEAEFSLWDNGQVLWSLEAFPVAELAHHLALWLQGPSAERKDFELDSMQADPGLIRLVSGAEGWRVGSILVPGLWSSPVVWPVLAAAAERFNRSVREGVAAMGIEPDFIGLGP